jgi:hypothetical protein
MEMNHWWARSQVKLGNYTKDEVEDFTGCIPLFLDKCIKGDEVNLEHDFYTEVSSEACTFEQDLQAKCGKQSATLDRYAIAVLSTLLR